jgi:enolase
MSDRDLGLEDISLRLIYNHRGEPTLEADVRVAGCLGRAAAPSGASRGLHELPPFPEGGPHAALALLPRLKEELLGVNAADQLELMSALERVGFVGGALAYAITLAAADAVSKARGQSLYQVLSGPGVEAALPIPLGNIVGGGRHAFSKRLDLQEVLVAPKGARDFREAVSLLFSVHSKVGELLARRDPCFTGGRGDEGAWTTGLDAQGVLELAREAVDQVADESGVELLLGVDFAASSLWDKGKGAYVYKREGVERDAGQQLEYVQELSERYGLEYLEDPFHEEAWEHFSALSRRLDKALVCADDLTATDRARLERAAKEKAARAAVLKVNQVGYLYRALEFASAARAHGIALVCSHRSGEVPEAHLAHVAVATGSSFIKAGIFGGERVAKLNELLRISELAGLRLRRPWA